MSDLVSRLRPQRVVVSAMLLSVSACCASAQSPQMRLNFDFGAKGVNSPSEFVRITPDTKYTPARGYGLQTDSTMSFSHPSLQRALGTEIADGLKKSGVISFRVDAPKGSYFIEIVMDGGTQKLWEGEIAVNGIVIESRITSFGYSAESEYAPPYWAIIRPVENRTGSLDIRIAAAGQASSVASLMLYPFKPGPVQCINGVFRKSEGIDAPNIDLALKLINSGKIRDAMRIVDAIPDQWRYERAYLLFAAASRPETESPHQFVEAAYALLDREHREHPSLSYLFDMRLAQLYLRADRHFKQAGWQWARDSYGLGIFGNCEVAAISAWEVASIQSHPLWPAAAWHLAKTCYGLWVEQHSEGMVERADSLFRAIDQMYPGNELVKKYLNEYQAPDVRPTTTVGVPAWAELQRTAVTQFRNIIEYWAESRQAENGEFGGKYDDDVEMLRWWPFARVAIDDSITLAGMKRLVDGIWNSDWISNGWCKRVRDVEHSSEPVADTQPMMIGFDYGNPVYVERCMQSVKLALDLWTAKNEKGHRHFKSSWYSSTEVDVTKPKDCDVSYNTRTVKAIRWFAWYTRHPEALRFLREWGDAWLEDCLRTDKGKPKGIVPAAIRFSDDAVGGYGDTWHHPGMFWDYYNYRGNSDMLMEFLTDYLLFKDVKYLQPIELSLELVRRSGEIKDRPKEVGSERWVAYTLINSGGFWEVAELWRLFTGNMKYDDLLKARGSAYVRFRLTGDEQPLRDDLAALLKDVAGSYELITSEGYFTDRIELRNLRSRDERGAGILESMYLGAPLVDLFYPFSPVFWKGFDTTFSALVLQATPASLALKAFNHTAKPAAGAITFLQLEPGRYLLTQGSDANNDGSIDRLWHSDTLMIRSRNYSWPVQFTPRQEELLVVKQLAAFGRPEAAMCDLAVTQSELSVKATEWKAQISIPVHNVGTAEATDIQVEITKDGAQPDVVARTLVRRIEAPLDLLPKSEKVTLAMPKMPGRYTLRVQLSGNGGEITDVNNVVSFTL